MLDSLTRSQTVVPSLPFTYGFDDVALVPGDETVDPDLCDASWSLDTKLSFDLPILAAAMDGVVDPGFATAFHRQGGLAVMRISSRLERLVYHQVPCKCRGHHEPSRWPNGLLFHWELSQFASGVA